MYTINFFNREGERHDFGQFFVLERKKFHVAQNWKIWAA